MANYKYYNNNKSNFDNFNWKKSKEVNFNGCPKPRSHVNGRQLSAHQLEEKFCSTVGGVSLQEVAENQKYMYQHEKIVEWKDSAVQEAFWDAKNRFLAKVQGQPCNIKLPDPNMFIDKIDWNSTIDPELLSDLEIRDSNSYLETEEHDGGVIVGISEVINHSDLTPDGWGDAEEATPQHKFSESHGDVGNQHWGGNGVKREETTFFNGWEDDYVDVTPNKTCSEENKLDGSSWNGYRKQQDNWYNRKGDHGGWGTSRYKISRYQHDNYGQPLNNHGGPLLTWKPVSRRW